MELSLNGKNALVGGSSQGIGRGAAEELAKLGATVYLLARNETSLAAARDELPTPNGQKHQILVADFSEPQKVEAEVKNALKEIDAFHILINNTGGPAPGALSEATTEQMLHAFQMHLFCNHLLVKAVSPGMQASGYGRIIQVISTSVREPIAGLGVSNTTRGAVASWSKTLSKELGPFGITVNNVLPGFITTQRLDQVINNMAKRNGQASNDVAENLKKNVPLRRFGGIEEIGGVIAFLSSPAAAYISGQSLAVDGGRMNSI